MELIDDISEVRPSISEVKQLPSIPLKRTRNYSNQSFKSIKLLLI